MVQPQRLISTFTDLCLINSPARREAAIADHLQSALEALGLRCVRDRAGDVVGGTTGNLIATLPGTLPDRPMIFLAAHMDTVEPTEGITIIRDGDWIKTDGTTILGADDRAGIAPILEALRVVQEQNLQHGGIQAVFTVCEEIGLLGAKALDRSLIEASFGFVLDSGPPVGSVVTSAPTQDSFDVRIIGRPAHAGAEPEKGISAIQAAARAIDRMRLGRIDPETTANVGVIQGGDATNIICAEVQLRAEARSRDPRKLEVQVQHMVDAFNEAAGHYGATAEIDIHHQYDAYNIAVDAPNVALALRAAERMGLPTRTRSVGGGSDANVFNSIGMAACVLGTGMTDVHTHDERIDVRDLVATAEWVVAIIKEAASS